MPDNKTNNSVAEQLLKIEHQNLIHWLHDDLGQNLVAIKSFANAIVEQNSEAEDDTVELAGMIKQATELAFRSTYDLMQELRSQEFANQSISDGLTNCLEQARLKSRGITESLEVDSSLDKLDTFTKAVILRSTRCFINFNKLSEQAQSISIELRQNRTDNARYALQLEFSYRGEFDILPTEYPGLSALQSRIEAIGGTTKLETNDRDALTLTLYLKLAATDGVVI